MNGIFLIGNNTNAKSTIKQKHIQPLQPNTTNLELRKLLQLEETVQVGCIWTIPVK